MGAQRGVAELYLDGKKVDRIPVQAVGSHHSVTVIMGKKEENDND